MENLQNRHQNPIARDERCLERQSDFPSAGVLLLVRHGRVLGFKEGNQGLQGIQGLTL